MAGLHVQHIKRRKFNSKNEVMRLDEQR
jgi:hypothetical protein